MTETVNNENPVYTSLAQLAKDGDTAIAMSSGRRVYRVPTESTALYVLASSRQTAVNAVARFLLASQVRQLDAAPVTTGELFAALREAAADA